MNIGFSTTYSRQFLTVPDTSFNILQASLVSPNGRNFLREIKARHGQIYSWTVSDAKSIDWCIRREVDGVVTDDIPKFLEMCKTFQEGKKPRWPIKLLLGFIYFNFWVYLFSVIFCRQYGTCIERQIKQKVKDDKDR